MRYKRVDKIDFDFSVLGYGCWGASGKGSWTSHHDHDQIEAIKTAIDLGINFFDVAPVYGLGHAEEVLGKAIKGLRDQVFIATKTGLPWNEGLEVRNDVSKDSILTEIDDSLKRLNVDYVDLYQVHWPSTQGIALEETMAAMEQIKAAGKTRYIGLTNFSVDDAKKASAMVDIVSMQGLFNMLEQNPESYHNIPLQYQTSKEVFPYVKEAGMAFFPYSPLFQGLLTGKITEDTVFGDHDVRNANPRLQGAQRRKYLKIIDEIMAIESLQGKKLSDVAINYLLAKEEITSVIASVMNHREVISNVKAMTWQMDSETVLAIDSMINRMEDK